MRGDDDSDRENAPSKSPSGSSQAIGRRSTGTAVKRYESFTYNGTEYRVGDDIVITMPKDEGSWGVARIIKIYHDELADDIPLLRLLWFWRATEVMMPPHEFICSEMKTKLYFVHFVDDGTAQQHHTGRCERDIERQQSGR